MRSGDFTSKLENRRDVLRRKKINARYEPETFTYRKRTRRTFCAKCGSKDTFKLSQYTPDFRIGKNIYIETKGYLKAKNRTAMEDFLHTHPEFDLRFLFGADNWLTRKRVKKYSDWADSVGIKYAIKEVPEEWIEEARKQIADRGKPL